MSNQSRGNRYSNDFKQQIYELYNSGQSVTWIGYNKLDRIRIDMLKSN